MDIIISNSSTLPIYEQIYRQLKNLIIAGDLEPGEMLPSIRNLAKDLRISVITTKRAYEELQNEGFIVTMPGKGTFVAAKNMDLIREEQMKQLEHHLEEALSIAETCDITLDELMDLLRLIGEE